MDRCQGSSMNLILMFTSYMATPEYRHSITNDSLADDLHVQNIEPPRPFLPEAYKRAPNTSEPRMGTHYADMTSEQLKPGKFDNIFLFGGHDGCSVLGANAYTRLSAQQTEFPRKYSAAQSIPSSVVTIHCLIA